MKQLGARHNTRDLHWRDRTTGPRIVCAHALMSTKQATSEITSHVAARAQPRLSRRAGFWAVACSFLALAAFSTAPSSLYGLYEHREHLSSLSITIVYAVYAVGTVVSLLLAGHVSDWYGRRAVLIPALAIAVAAAVVFLAWKSLAGLLFARVLTGVALGAGVATATAFIADLDGGPAGVATRRSGIVATVANVGGLAIGPLIAGLLARYEPHPLTLPFILFLAALVGATFLVVLAPEGHPAIRPRPAYHPQRLRTPAKARAQFIAGTTAALLSFAVFGLFGGLAGRFLAGQLHHPSPALTGLTIFLAFGSGVIVQTTTTTWPVHRLLARGIPPIIVGLCVLVLSAWTSPPSLALFLIGAVIAGAGCGAMFRGGLTLVISASSPDDRAGALATFFTAGYAGISLPVVGVGLALQHLSPRVTLLIFGAAVGLGILAAAPILVRPVPVAIARSEPVSDPMTAMCRCFGVQTAGGDGQPQRQRIEVLIGEPRGDASGPESRIRRDRMPHA
jgi:MFS family permease